MGTVYFIARYMTTALVGAFCLRINTCLGVQTDSKKGLDAMPKKLHKLVSKLKKKGLSESSSYGIAAAALKKKKGKKK